MILGSLCCRTSFATEGKDGHKSNLKIGRFPSFNNVPAKMTKNHA